MRFLSDQCKEPVINTTTRLGRFSDIWAVNTNTAQSVNRLPRPLGLAVGCEAQELARADYELLHLPRGEPWDRGVAGLQSPQGAIVGISYPSVLHEQD